MALPACTWLSSSVAIAVAWSSAAAQSRPPTQPALNGQRVNSSQKIAAGGSDIDPLRGNPNVLPRDLRQPLGFQELYEVRSTDAYGREQTSFARRSGSLTALFPRSVYVPTKNGLVPDIPAGTVFVIDSGRPNTPPPANILRAYNALDYTAPLVSLQGAAAAAPPRLKPEPRATAVTPRAWGSESIWMSEEYRRKVVADLLAVGPRKEGG